MAKDCTSLTCGTHVTMSDVDLDSTEGKEHPNASPFSGTLLLLDEPSQQPPHGADGHAIYVPRRVAEQRLKTLPGMGINYESDLEGHNPQNKIGVITDAWIDGNKAKVKGLIWKKDFPEAVRTFRQNKGQLGMSMELGDVYVREKDEPVWHLEDFHFTGATVLRKDHAAYEGTDLAASKHFVKALAAARAAMGIFNKGGKQEMADKAKKEEKKGQSQGALLVAGIAAAVEKSFSPVMKAFGEQQDTNKSILKTLQSISASQAELVNGLHELALGKLEAATDNGGDGDVEAEEAVEVNAEADTETVEAADADATMAMARKPAADATEEEDDATAEDDANEGGDATDATDEYAASDATNYSSSEQDDTGSGSTPGDLNPKASERAKSNARSGSTQMSPGGASSSPAIAAAARRGTVASISAAAKVIRSLKAENEGLKEQNRRDRNRIAAIEASLERYAERVERRSVTPEIQSLLEKSGYDVREMLSSKQRMTVNDVDAMFASSGVPLEPQMRAAFKNQLLQMGLMETGEVRRFVQ
jgi:hypothetical protein